MGSALNGSGHGLNGSDSLVGDSTSRRGNMNRARLSGSGRLTGGEGKAREDNLQHPHALNLSSKRMTPMPEPTPHAAEFFSGHGAAAAQAARELYAPTPDLGVRLGQRTRAWMCGCARGVLFACIRHVTRDPRLTHSAVCRRRLWL